MIPTIQLGGLGRFASSTSAVEDLGDAPYWAMLVNDYTLTNTTSQQKAFNTTTNGALTLEVGYFAFEWFIYMTDLVATSNALKAFIVGSGTAVADRFLWLSAGRRATNALTAEQSTTGAGEITEATTTTIFSGDGAQARGLLSGQFRVTTSGTIIPSISMQVAAAAVMKAGSFFHVRYLGPNENASSGWS